MLQVDLGEQSEDDSPPQQIAPAQDNAALVDSVPDSDEEEDNVTLAARRSMLVDLTRESMCLVLHYTCMASIAPLAAAEMAMPAHMGVLARAGPLVWYHAYGCRTLHALCMQLSIIMH